MRPLALLLLGLVVAGCSGPGSSPAERLRVATGPHGSFITDGEGRAVYSFSGDAPGQTGCLTNCATVWPPVLVRAVPTDVDAAIDRALLSLVTRPDSSRQLTYARMPLYYSQSDRPGGSPFGHYAMSFGGRFTLVSPAGTPVPGPR